MIEILWRQYPSRRNIVFTVLFSILAALSLNACSDTNNVSGPEPLSPDALLSTLTVTPGTLQPVFSSDAAIYTVDVLTTVTSVTVMATPQDANASMTINGQGTPSGQARTITPLNGPGLSTPIQIVVTAVNGSQNTYFVTVNRAALGGNNNLQRLTVTSSPAAGPLTPAFVAPGVSGFPGYTVTVASGVNSVTVTATLQDPNATMTINGQGTPSGQARTITPLNGPGLSTLVTIEVTAPNGTPKTYFVTVNRAALGGNNNLQRLTVTSSPAAGPLTPAFVAPGVSGFPGYMVNVAATVPSVTVVAQPQGAGATVSINGQPTTSQSVSLGAAGSTTPISIVVTAPNGSQKPYLVTVNRAALGGNNNLQSLTVTPGPLAPAFVASTTIYTVDIADSVPSVTVAAQPQDAGATVSINGQPTTSQSVSLGAAGSTTRISIVVTAPNGNEKTYTVGVNRAAVVPPPAITTTNPLPDGNVGIDYNQQLEATGGSGSLTWTISGSLPDGLDMNPAGLISGTPTRAGAPSAFTVTVTDARGLSDTQPLSIEIINNLAS